jgi:uncharacterized RDD family membrane protein YckC
MFCSYCGKENVDTVNFCGSCGGQISGWAARPCQVSNVSEAELASIGRRLGAIVFDIVIELFTLYIGWFIWFLIVCGRGQTPGKQLLGIYAASVHDPERRLSWGSMFLREFVIKGLLFGWVLSMISGGIVGIFDYLWAFWDGSGYRQTLHDKVIQSSVYRVQ